MTLQELFKNPENWTQGTHSRYKSNNDRISCRDIPRAKRNRFCFCLLGGIEMCYKVHQRKEVEAKLTTHIQINTPFPNIPTFNDCPDTTIEDIQNLVKECNV